MLRKVHSMKGLNLRDSDINRPPEFASDLRNVEKNSQGEIIKRWGTDLKSLTWRDKAGSPIGAKTIIDLWEYVGDGSNRELLALVSDGLYRIDGFFADEIPNASNITPTWTKPTTPVEYNKVLYWNDPDTDTKTFDEVVPLWKYDGGRICRAGAPKPSIASTALGVGTYASRSILLVRDGQGNVTLSGFYLVTDTSNAAGSIEATTINDSYYDGFVQLYGSASGAQIINSGNLTLNTGNHNIEAGDLILVGNSKGELVYLKVDSVVANTSITFTSASVGTESFTYINGSPIDKTYDIATYRAPDEFFGYTASIPSTETSPAVSDVNLTINLGAYNADLPRLTEVYDDTFLRVLPPKFKYLTTFRNHIVGGLQISSFDPDNNEESPLSSTADNTSPTDNIVWSDFPTSSNGSTVETFNPLYVYAVGVSEDGPISAIHGNDDSLAVHKEEQSYYVYGDFISATLRVRKAQTSRIGAAAHRSIEELEGGHLYVSSRGVYVSAGGQTPAELSDIIEPFFRASNLTSIYDLQNANSINDFYREKIYIFLPYIGGGGGDILVYDYYFREWFIHDNLDCSGGFVAIDSAIYFSDGTSLFQRNLSSTTDSGNRIDAYYRTGWFDLGEPTLRKKFIRAILMSMSSLEFEVEVTSQCDWINTDVGNSTIEFNENESVVDTVVPRIQGHSMRLEFRNKKKKQSMLLTGYEVEFEPTQSKPKGQK